MSFTLVGYYETIESLTLTELAAMSDQHVTTSGDDVLVPEFASKLGAVCFICPEISQAQLTAPSLRERSLIDVRPLNLNNRPIGGRPFLTYWEKPIQLEPGEGARALASEHSVGVSSVTALVWLVDEISSMPDGEIETIRATSTTTTKAFEWTLCQLNLTQQLRAGRYAIVGMRAESANAIAARLVIPGSPYRPGTLAYNTCAVEQPAEFRNGGLGSWGEFEHTFIPQVELLALAEDTTQNFYLDIVKIA